MKKHLHRVKRCTFQKHKVDIFDIFYGCETRYSSVKETEDKVWANYRYNKFLGHAFSTTHFLFHPFLGAVFSERKHHFYPSFI